MSAETHTKEIECGECARTVTVASDWTYSICRQCNAGIYTPKLRKCSRCGFHTSDWGAAGNVYCRPCVNLTAREYRARKKAKGQPETPRPRVCKPCQREILYPSSEWTAGVSWCKSCTNRIARENRQGKELPPLPDFPLHKMPTLQCRLCKRSKAHTAKNFPSRQKPNVCKPCLARQAKASQRRLKERECYVTCRQCGESVWHPAGGAGWQGNQCPECARAYGRERYPARAETHRAQSRAAYHRKQAENQAESRSSVEQDAPTPQTPENAPQGGKGGSPESSPPVDIEDLKERQAIAERVRRKLQKKGLQPLTGKVVVERG